MTGKMKLSIPDRLIMIPAALVVGGLWLFDLLLLAFSLAVLQTTDQQKEEHHVM
jgi:hypothetical protein